MANRHIMRRIVRGYLCSLQVAGWSVCATLAVADADLCYRALQTAAQETEVPVDVLLALTRLETGRGGPDGLAPWPWALNIAGAGHWPPDRQAALHLVNRALAGGEQSIDLGCFQINWRWHGAEFDSPVALLDPLANARYAARFLRDLFDETGDWTRAAGAYHSRNEVHAAPYRARFASLRDDPAPAPVRTAMRGQAYPLFQGGAAGSRGSLVPLTGGAG